MMKLLEPRNALLAGGTGLIGQALRRRLVESLNYARIHALVRRAGAAGTRSIHER